MRQEMDLYYREQFMPRYSELLRRYYAALAEQKKKGDDR
jgi:tRNA 2-selenouridine synthase SelU